MILQVALETVLLPTLWTLVLPIPFMLGKVYLAVEQFRQKKNHNAIITVLFKGVIIWRGTLKLNIPWQRLDIHLTTVSR